jgi:ribose 5-phosphate isomerase B
MKWFVGSDHAGFNLKQVLMKTLRELGDEVVDLGSADATTSVDYPDFGERVARAVVAEKGAFGLCVCGTGVGVSIAANKVTGARAARVSDSYSAQMARAHNDANILCVGERVTGPGQADHIVRTFRDATFEGGRHQRRVDKITEIEKKR